MDGDRAGRLVQGALRCYPARWRRRHGDEAAELAALLINDGTPVTSVAGSFLAGAAREWLVPRPGRRVSTAACALLAAACLLSVSAGLAASAGPARAASTNQARTGQGQGQGRGQGHSLSRGHCGPGPAEPVPGVSVSHPRPFAGGSPFIWETGHGRPC